MFKFVILNLLLCAYGIKVQEEKNVFSSWDECNVSEKLKGALGGHM